MAFSVLATAMLAFAPATRTVLPRSAAVGVQTRATCTMSVKGQIETLVKENDVVVFSKSYCPFCGRTKSLFADTLKVDAKVLELDKMDDGDDYQAELLSMTGQKTVPNVWVKGKHLGGNDDTQKANQDGSLKTMLGL
eukprot:CAMPEP_0206059004 /NCGR_PEP_ID=MMETSP1466-20131121/47996_1 /ASSEMBLY_ACC=CAM_ASM_001126 /TAXON_ID=44452 /ORGANISM="Pavlova gyrans, Strain CCMP608" /LENGTH=136 /DNA_ID=CAMNT_0053434315 /DNA_START=86 /DNA_END=496 /DNA_ORIENTATION=+